MGSHLHRNGWDKQNVRVWEKEGVAARIPQFVAAARAKGSMRSFIHLFSLSLSVSPILSVCLSPACLWIKARFRKSTPFGCLGYTSLNLFF